MSKTNFSIYIDKDTDKEFEVLLQKQPYINEKEISELFSHLVHIDETQKEKNIFDGKLNNKFIKMKFSYPNPDEPSKSETEILKIPLGYGHFSRGLEHLREIGKENLDKEVSKSDKFFKALSEKYDKYLKNPTAIGIDSLQKSGWATMESCAKILECFPSEELQQLLKGFSQGDNTNNKENNKENNKNISDYLQEFLTKNQQEKSKEISNELNKNENSQKEIGKGQQNLTQTFSKEQMNQVREAVNEIIKKNPNQNAKKDKEIHQHKTELGMAR